MHSGIASSFEKSKKPFRMGYKYREDHSYKTGSNRHRKNKIRYADELQHVVCSGGDF